VACIIKLFTAVINSVMYKSTVFVIVRHFLFALKNTLAFYVTVLLTGSKSFMIHTFGLYKFNTVPLNGSTLEVKTGEEISRAKVRL
jgi:hypothetical protein